MATPIISIQNINKTFYTPEPLQALTNVSCDIATGEP